MFEPDRAVGTVLITGGSSGLGAAVAEAVAAAGGTPVVVDQSPPKQPWRYYDTDLANTDHAHSVVAQLAQETPLDAVVTCAGVDACGSFADVDRTSWEWVVQVNLFGTAAVLRAALPSLRRQRGRIVTVASTLGLRALPDASAYGASKFGVVGMSRALAAELAPEVPVTCLIPGGMETSFFDGRPAQYQPPPEADLMDPAGVATIVTNLLRLPSGADVRELIVTAAGESSWP